MKNITRHKFGILRHYPVFLIAVVLFLLLSNVSNGQELPQNIYVSDELGDDELGDGTLGNPYQSILHALFQTNYGDTIMILPGVYGDPIYMDYYSYWAHLKGVEGPEQTIIDIDSAYTALYVYGGFGDEISITGLTFKSLAQGVYASNTGLEITNCAFDSCTSFSGEGAYGGGLYMYSCDATIENCSFTTCYAETYGGALYANSSNVDIINCYFDNNFADYGAAIGVRDFTDTCFVLVANCILKDGSGVSGAGVYFDECGGLITNNLFMENEAGDGTAAADITAFTTLEFYNNIIVNNINGGVECLSEGTIFTGYNCYFGNTGQTFGPGCDDIGNNITSDPLFVDYHGGDYHLQDNSPLINVGKAHDRLPPWDFDGKKRVVNDRVDIGPDEWADCSITSDFNAVPTSGCPGLYVRFNAQAGGDYDSLFWDFGDSTYAAGLEEVYHTYDTTGFFTVRLYAITPCTTVVAVKDTLIKVMLAPDAQFGTDVTSGCAPLTVQFEDLSTGRLDEWLWTFGDGETSTEQNPTHEYAEQGTYNVRLRVSNGCSFDTLRLNSYITVEGNAQTDFTAEPVAGSAPLEVSFSDLSLNEPFEWSWNFGDGNTSDIQNPTNVYSDPGRYAVWLASLNDCGTFDTALVENYITVYGFDLTLNDTLDDKYTKTIYFSADTLFGQFNREINLEAVTVAEPSRGTIEYMLIDPTVTVNDSSRIIATLSKDVPRGIYGAALIGTAQGGAPMDTMTFELVSYADPLILVNEDEITFDTTQVDSTTEYVLRVRNQSSFADGFEIEITGITFSGSSAFSAAPTSATIFSESFRDITLSFVPPDTGHFAATMTIHSDDPAIPEFDVQLSGIGIPERVPPYVRSTDPEDGTDDISFKANVTVRMSEPLELEQVNSSNFVFVSGKVDLPIEGQLNYLPTVWEVVFSPDDPLLPLDTITVTVSGDLADPAGNTLDGDRDGLQEGSPDDDYSFSFVTGPGVHPGDANNDGKVNEADILPLGVYWMMTGPERTGGLEWRLQVASAWDPLAATYADCNGDGVVNENDVSAIGVAWDQTHDFAAPAFVPDEKEMRQHKEAFEAIYFALASSEGDEFADRVRELISKYVEIDARPDRFTLSQNYPNPFNPSTHIHYNLPDEAHVVLTIHNILGQTVTVLVDDRQGAGFYRVTWDGMSDYGEQVPSGIYFYRLTAGSFSEVKKMMLLR